MKKIIIAGITVATLLSASVAPVFASTSTGTTSTTTVTTNGLRALW